MTIDFLNRDKIGNFSIGMSVKELEAILLSSFYEKKSIFFNARIRRFYQSEGLFFDILDGRTIEAIEILKTNIFNFQEKNLFKLSKKGIQELFLYLDPLTIEKDGFTSKKLGISIFIEEGKSKASSIIVFQDGYYERKKDYDLLQDEVSKVTIDDLYKLLLNLGAILHNPRRSLLRQHGSGAKQKMRYR